MKNKKHMKQILTQGILPFSLSLSMMLIPNSYIQVSSTQQNAENETISLRSDVIKWVFNTIGGKRYKRLYNFSTRSWVGDWILVR